MDKKKKAKVVIGVTAVLLCGVIYIAANYRQGSDGVVTEHFADAAHTAETSDAKAGADVPGAKAGSDAADVPDAEAGADVPDAKAGSGVSDAPENPEVAAADLNSRHVYIHICGEVKKPGVYTFPAEPRLVEVVEKAGGFTKKADQASVNQAERVSDGSQITIAAKQMGKAAGGGQGDFSGNGSSGGASAGDGQPGKVNINTATKEELMTLNGIGEAKAVQIVSYRESNGAFKKIEEIMNISGIKDGVFSKIKDYITV